MFSVSLNGYYAVLFYSICQCADINLDNYVLLSSLATVECVSPGQSHSSGQEILSSNDYFTSGPCHP